MQSNSLRVTRRITPCAACPDHPLGTQAPLHFQSCLLGMSRGRCSIPRTHAQRVMRWRFEARAPHSIHRNTRNATEVHAITVALVPPFARLNRRAKTWTRPHRTTCTRTGAWACQISTIDSSINDRICFSAAAAAACAQPRAPDDAQCRV
jgi:hypothetical protein